MYPTLKALTSLLCLIILFSACKKDERTVSEWGQLAESKLKEIEMLSEDLPCQEQANFSIQELSNGCSSKPYPILSSDVETFNKLKQEYFDLLGKQTDAMIEEGYIIDPCWNELWNFEQPIRLECNNNRMQLITSQNLSIEEAKPLADATYNKIMDFVNSQTCTDASSLDYTALVKDKVMNLQYIPYSRKSDITELQKMASLYNSLKFRIINSEGPTDYETNIKRVKSIECANGKPTIVLED